MKRLWFVLLLWPLLTQAGTLPVTWTAPTTCTDGTAISGCPITGYQLWSAPCTASAPLPGPLSGPPAATTAAAVTAFNFANTPAGTTWCVTVAANSAAGLGPQSNVAVATVTSSPGAPAIQTPTASLKVVNGDVFLATQIPDGWGFTKVGTVPVGTPCDAKQGVNQYNEVPQTGVSVSWLTAVQPFSIVALCN